MMPRIQLVLILVISYAIVNVSALAADASRKRPNVLLIMTDNQSASLLGAYGNPVIETPNIDRLANEGVLFERAYATSGVCSPSRAVLLTGLIPSANGVHNGLPSEFSFQPYSAIAEYRNWPQTLADAGYSTGFVGKYHLGVHEEPSLGFDFWVTFRGGHTTSFVDAAIFDNGKTYNVADSNEHLTDFWTRRATDFIQSQEDSDSPFFLWLSYNGPYILPPTVNQPPVSRFAERYEDNVPPMPQEPVHASLREQTKSTIGETEFPDYVGGTIFWAAIDALNNRKAMINIAAETTHVDNGIGEVLRSLESADLLEDTLIIFLSDQGSAYGQLGLWGNSSWAEPAPAYNANMQIPLIFRHPARIPAGQRRKEMINQFDIFPTVLDYLGLSHLQIANSPGQSFAPILMMKDIDWNNEVFYEYLATRAIQTDRWKYVKRIYGEPDELFDLKADPEEKNNLIDNPAHRSVVVKLDRRLSEFFGEYAAPEFDVWKGGTGKARLYYDEARTNWFRDASADFKEPFIDERPPFRDN